jgi:hypothetical protein
MKNTYKLLYLLLMAVIITSCKNEPIMFDRSKTFVAFAYTSTAVNENANSVDIPVMVSAVDGSPSVSVDYEVVTDGISDPAVEGTDFTIVSEGPISFPDGSGYAFITVHPIDNALFTGFKSFKIRLTSNSKDYPNGAENEITVVIRDDEHPLFKWIGTYYVEAMAYYEPGISDEVWIVTTEPDPKDVNYLIINGVATQDSRPIKAKINLEEMSITFAQGQSLGDIYADENNIPFGISIYKSTNAIDDVILDEPLIGDIEDDGTIRIDLWSELITSGKYKGRLRNVFNTTWTKE